MLLFNQRDEPSAEFACEMERLAALVADMQRIHRGVSPEAMAGNGAPILDRWVLAMRTVPLAGLSTGHPELVGENRLIGTSDLWCSRRTMPGRGRFRAGIGSAALPKTLA